MWQTHFIIIAYISRMFDWIYTISSNSMFFVIMPMANDHLKKHDIGISVMELYPMVLFEKNRVHLVEDIVRVILGFQTLQPGQIDTVDI